MFAQIIQWFRIRLCVSTPPRGCRYNHTLIFNGKDVCRKQLPESRLWQYNPIAKCSLQNLLVQFSARATEATAVLPTTRKHRTVAGKYKCVVPSPCSLGVRPACPWRSDTDCQLELTTEGVKLCQTLHGVWDWLTQLDSVHPAIQLSSACSAQTLHSSPSWLHITVILLLKVSCWM